MKRPRFVLACFAVSLISPNTSAQSLTLGTTSLTFGNGAGAGTLLIGATGAWSAATATPWLHVSARTTSGTGNALFQFTYDSNPGATRTGTITFTGEATLTISQAGTSYVPSQELSPVIPQGLEAPRTIATDSQGNIYFSTADSISKWSPDTREVTTVVTTAGSVSADLAGTVYFATNSSTQNGNISKINTATGQITPVVSGLGLPFPTYFAVDAAGNVYWTITAGAFSSFNGIQKWTAATGRVTSFLNTGPLQPEGIALDKDGNVYLSGGTTDSQSGVVQKLTVATNQITTLISGLGLALGVAVDTAGNVYVASDSIHKWTAATGQASLLISTGLNSPFDVTVDAVGNVYIADTYDFAVKEWMPGTGQLTTLLSSELNFPFGLALDRVGNLYVADYNHNAIKEWSRATGQVSTLASNLNAKPSGVAVDASGNVYIAEPYAPAIEKWSASTGTALLLSSGLSQPTALAIDPAGNLYITDRGDQTVKEYLPATGELVVLISNLDCTGIALDAAGNLYLSAGLTMKWNAATGELTTLAPGVPSENVAVDGAGNVYVGWPMRKWTAATGYVSLLPSQGISHVYGLAVDQAGTLYVTNNGSNAVDRITQAFTGPSAIAEPLIAGNDQLLPVLPSGLPLDAVSDQSWLTITHQANDVVGFSFESAGTQRAANISLLGRTIPVTQVDNTLPTVVSYSVLFGSESYIVTGSTRNDLPWQIRSIQILFSKPIAAATVASLTGVSATALSGLGTNTLTWTINPISVGSFTLTLAQNGPNAVMDANGNTLTGNVSEVMQVLWGDFNDDGVVDAADLSGVNFARLGGSYVFGAADLAGYEIFADLNGDGLVDISDMQIVRTQIGSNVP